MAALPLEAPAQGTGIPAVLGQTDTPRQVDQLALAPGTGLAYGLSKAGRTVFVLGTQPLQVLKSVVLPEKPTGLAVDPGGRKAYVIAKEPARSKQRGSLLVVDSEGKVATRLPIPRSPQGIVLNPADDTLIISFEAEKKLLVFSRETLSLVREISLPFRPRLLSLDPGAGRAVVAAREEETSILTVKLLLVDLASGCILGEVPFQNGIKGVVADPESASAVVAGPAYIGLIEMDQGTVMATLEAAIPLDPLRHGKIDDRGGEDFFGLAVYPGAQTVFAAVEGGFLLLRLPDGEQQAFPVEGVQAMKALAVDPVSNLLLGSYRKAGSQRSPNYGVLALELPRPSPEITSLTPTGVARGSGGVTLALDGRGFLESSEGFFNNQACSTLFLDAHHLQLVVPGVMFSQGGSFPITVVNPTPGGGPSNSILFPVFNPAAAATVLEPASTPAGSPGLTLTVRGANFLPESLVSVNGHLRTAQILGEDRLTVVLTSADLEMGAALDIAVSNPGPGGGGSPPLSFLVTNPAPSLASLNPNFARAGSPGFILALTGSGFARSAAVRFNNQPVETAWIDDGRLEAAIPPEFIQTDGSLPVRVVNPGPGGGDSGELEFLVTKVSSVLPLPEGAYGKQYEDLFPGDATLPAYDPRRFALITGLVKDHGGQPLPGVTVGLHGYPQYGTAPTDASGRFSLPLDGGGPYTLIYRKAGYLTAHRTVAVPWRAVVAAETPVLIAEDEAATRLTFDGNPQTVLTHRSTPVSDAFGSRSVTLVFSGDNRAWAADASGQEQALTEITVRATEYDRPETMPARLPPNSAYTYCAELSVEGVRSVRFEKPAVMYVENFLGFAVGEIVPVGFYDRDRAVWVPSDNGRVVRLLDTNGDGIVDAYDDVGDGQVHGPAVGLSDPGRYKPGDSFWRVELDHFSPWDCNWPYGPAPGAIGPNPSGEPVVANVEALDDISCINSYVEDRNCVFHEDLPLPGTGYFLHYASNRTPGYKPRVTIPASGPTVPASLIRILVIMEVAGRVYETSFPPEPNRVAEFVWDGRDHLGREVFGSAQARIRVGFEYPLFYYTGNSIYEQAFAQPGTSTTWKAGRDTATGWKETVLTIYREGGVLARGWTLSAHQVMNPGDPRVLQKGDGTRLKNNVQILDTIAAAQPVGDGISTLRGIVLDKAGNVYFSDGYNYRYMKADPNGVVTHVPTADTNLGMVRMYGLALDRAGNLLFTNPDSYNGGFVGRVEPSGTMTVVAGIRQKGFSGDGGPATEAQLNWPEDLARDDFGNIYITDTGNNRIRKIDPAGIITTIAGNGQFGFSGDGGPATEASLSLPRGVAVDRRGNVYIADSTNHRIRKIDAGGIITTIAGTGEAGFDGDGGPAVQAALLEPRGLVLDGAGNIYIADSCNCRIRKIDTRGIISTLAGNGDRANENGEGGPAVQATVHDPMGVALDGVGNVYVAVTGYGKIKKISWPEAYAAQGMTDKIIFADEDGQGYVLDSTGRHEKTVDLATGLTRLTFGYDEARRLISITDRFGDRTTIQRDGGGAPVSIMAPDGQVTRLTVDTRGDLSAVAYPDQSVQGLVYNAEGLLLEKTDPRGFGFDHQYDADGLITGILDPEGGVWRYSRAVDLAGEVSVTLETGEGNRTQYRDRTDSTGGYSAWKTDPSGQVTTFIRSSDGTTESEVIPCGTGRTRRYDLDPAYRYKYLKEFVMETPGGRTQTVLNTRSYQDTNGDKVPDRITRGVSLNGRVWTSVREVLAGTVSGFSPQGRTVTLTYDPATLLPQGVAVGGLQAQSFGYDGRGRLISSAVGTRTTTLAYDAGGNVSTVVTPDQRVFRFSYDPMGRVLTQTRPDNTVLRFDYDPNGNLTVLTAPQNTPYRFDYTGVNLRSRLTPPLSDIYRYGYDRERNLTSIRFPSGREVVQTYTQGRLTGISTPEGPTAFSYACGNLPAEITRGTERMALAYDGSLLINDTRTGLVNQTLGYAYNDDFRISRVSYGGASHDLLYDQDGLLTGAGAFTISRNDQNGLPEGVGDGTLTLARTFNGYGERDGAVYTLAGSEKYRYTLTRNQAGRIARKVETVGGVEGIYDYGYDDLGRLTEVKKNGDVVEAYAYDANGNRLWETNAFKGVTDRAYNFSVEDHLLTAGAEAYQYDLDGFLTGRTQGAAATAYRYSSRGELLGATLPDGKVLSYDHDPLGRRIGKRVNGVLTEKYLWRDAATLLAVYDGSDQPLMRFEYADDRTPLAMTAGGSTYYLLYDPVGSLRAVVDPAGVLVKRVDYDSFGYIINDTNTTFYVPLGFAGGLHDRDTGLVRFGARDYDPNLGRWTAKDPIDFGGGDTNLYGYVGGDPVNWVDPLGLFCGSGITEYFVPDSWWGKYNFRGACSKHDNCYGTCGKEKIECDENFKKDMFEECAKLNGYWSQDCNATASVYFWAVKIFGSLSYKFAQDKLLNLKK